MNYPLIVGTLREFNLITEEQAEQAWAEWDDAMEIERWWWDLAHIAMGHYAGFWRRNFGSWYAWKRDWIEEHRA